MWRVRIAGRVYFLGAPLRQRAGPRWSALVRAGQLGQPHAIVPAVTALRIATCQTLPEPDPDEAPLAAALAAAGVEARLAAWDDPLEDWSAPIPTLLRTTWNYALAAPEFLRWVERTAAAAPLWNPAQVVRGNVHKRYLLELAARGVPTVPTLLVERGTSPSLAECAARLGCERLVAKPAIGAGSLDTARFSAASAEDAPRFAAHLAAVTARCELLVQPFVASVLDYGERSMVWIDGELSHAIRKAPRFSGDDERIDGPMPIAADERALAEAALAPLASEILYARVDLARDDKEQPMVMELELIEPSLFFSRRPGSAERLVHGLLRRLAAS